jgi:hypothetical protein
MFVTVWPDVISLKCMNLAMKAFVFLLLMAAPQAGAEDNTSSIPNVCQRESYCQPCCERVISSQKNAVAEITQPIKSNLKSDKAQKATGWDD